MLRREYSKIHYRKYKQKYLDRNSVSRKKLKDYVHRIKESSPCSDCGRFYPYYVMDFDHQQDKLGLIIDFIRRNNRTELEKEIKKCQVVCSNCHRTRSHSRLSLKKLSTAEEDTAGQIIESII